MNFEQTYPMKVEKAGIDNYGDWDWDSLVDSHTLSLLSLNFSASLEKKFTSSASLRKSIDVISIDHSSET